MTVGDQWLVKLRALIDERYVLVVAVLLALLVVGAWGVHGAHVSPDTEVEERVAASWTATGGFEHGATVVNGTDAFAEGEEVTNRTTYFTNPMPVLEGTFVYRHDAPEAVDAETEAEIVIRSVERTDDEVSQVHWSITEPLDSNRTEGLAAGKNQTVPFEVDVDDATARIKAIETELGTSPGTVEVLIRAETSIEGTVRDESIEDTTEARLRIKPGQDAYEVENQAGEESYETIERTPVPVDPGPVRSIGSVLLLVGSLSGLAGLAAARQHDALVPEDDRDRIAFSRERAEFDDWITRGELAADLRDRPRIAVDSLKGIVDVAIDCNKRVIEDDKTYFVVDDELLYVYDASERAWRTERVERAGDDETDTDGTGVDGAETES